MSKRFPVLKSKSCSVTQSVCVFASLLLNSSGIGFSLEPAADPPRSTCGTSQSISMTTEDATPWKLGQAGRSSTLLAFLRMQPDTEASESRQQALVLKSVIHQHPGWGIRGALADYAPVKRTHQEEITSLRNAFYDWGLEDVAFVLDSGSQLATKLGVRTVPSLFLISGPGCVVWAHIGRVSTFELEATMSRLLQLGEEVESHRADKRP